MYHALLTDFGHIFKLNESCHLQKIRTEHNKKEILICKHQYTNTKNYS